MLIINTIIFDNTILMPARKTGNLLLDFFKNILFRKDINNHKKYIPSNIKSAEDVESFIMVDNFQCVEYINSYIHPNLFKKITELQEYAYAIDKTGIEAVECCVCLETNIKIHPLECKHSLCIDCYDNLLKNNLFDCPICRRVMKSITIEKFYAIMTQLECNDIGILYLPPIYINDDNIWKDCDLFIDVFRNEEQKENLIKSIKIINNENYVVVYTNNKIQKILSSTDFDKIKKIKKIDH